jgi:iron complex outermembrane recepter protein
MFNVAAFHSQSTDFQFFYVDVARASQIIGNIDKVDIKGIEIDFRFLRTKFLELDGGLGITESRIRKNAADPTTVGNYAPKQTPWKLNLGAQYTVRITDSVNGFARLDYEHRSKKYWHPDNVAVSGSLNLVGLRLGLREIKEKWSLNLFGRNLTDKKYYADYNSAKYSGGVTDIGSLAPSRTLGIEAKIQFY